MRSTVPVRLLSLVTGLLLAPAVSAQLEPGWGLYSIGYTSSVIDDPDQVAPHDIDGDGDEDVLLSQGDELRLLETKDQAQRVPLRVLVELPGLERFVLANVDGDADLDVLALVDAAAVPRLVWVERAVGFHVAARAERPFGPTVDAILGGPWLAEFDGDGLEDMAFLGRVGTDAVLVVLTNQGDGTFQERIEFGLIGAFGDPVFVLDLDADGFTDVLTENAGTLRALRGGASFAWPAATAATPLAGTLVDATTIRSQGTERAALVTSTGGVHAVRIVGSTLDIATIGDAALGLATGPESRVIGIDHDHSGDESLAVVAPERTYLFDEIDFDEWTQVFQTTYLSTPQTKNLACLDVDHDSDLDLVHGKRVLHGATSPGAVYCSGEPNSTQDRATLRVTGYPDATAASLTLTSFGAPDEGFGLLLASTTPGLVPNAGGGAGTLCLDGAIGRFDRPGELRPILARSWRLTVQGDAMPHPVLGRTSVVAGDRWHYQLWYRDVIGAFPTSNLSDAVVVEFR